MLNSLTQSDVASANADAAFRQPPFNLELEQALLGAALVNNEVVHRVADIIRPEHFFDGLHETIFDAICETVEANRIANPLTLKARFEDFPPVGDLTVPQYLGRLAGQASTILNAQDYARAIVDLSARRRLILVGEEMVNEAYDLSVDVKPQVLIEDAERKLFEIAEKARGARDEITFADASASALKDACEAYQSGGKMRGLSTGFADLDARLGGLQKSDLIILAGRPSMGKTALAINIAWNVAREGLAVDFRSLEMGSGQLAMRILSSVSGIPGDKLVRGTTTEEEIRSVIDAQRRVANTPLLIDESGGLSIAALAARARRAKRKHGTELIVIDYLQLMAGNKRARDGRVQEVTEITTGLKALAKELQVPIIALSQLNRSVEGRTEKRPQLSDLRESGSIEQDADVVMFVYREEYYVEREEPERPGPGDLGGPVCDKHAEWQRRLDKVKGKAEVVVGKHRHSQVGIVPMAFNGPLTQFSDLAREYASP